VLGSSSSGKSAASASGGSWNKGAGFGGGKGVSEKMWKDLTDRMAKLDIEIDRRNK
jgi:hypothetical protein